MGLLRGIPITLYIKTQAGVDGFGAPIYTETAIVVDNVLVSPLSETEQIEQQNLTGRKVVYRLGIPKGDTHVWKNCRVNFSAAISEASATSLKVSRQWFRSTGIRSSAWRLSMSKKGFVPDYKGFDEFRRSPEVQEVIKEHAERIRASLGGNYKTDLKELSTRAVASVYTEDPKEVRDNYDNYTLLKALHS